MKRIFVFVLASFLISSCTSHIAEKLTKKSAEDIKVDKLKDECDCIEALDIIAADYLDVVGNNDRESIGEMSDEAIERLQKKVDPIVDKRRDVDEHCRELFRITHTNFDNGSDCKLYDDLNKKAKEIEDRF